jgi:hypothetical protein
MSPQLINTPSIFRALTALALVFAIFQWSVWAPEAKSDLSEYLTTLSMVCCSVILSLIGNAVITLAAQWCRRDLALNTPASDSPFHPLPFISRAVLALGIGQLAVMFYVFARSALSGAAYLLVKRQIPIGNFEILLLLASVLLVTVKTTPQRSISGKILPIASFIVILICILAPLCFRELPRDVALSSDPDQHAFWALQVLRLGIVPWDQGLTGVGPFGYPAGFAVLNAIWMRLSGLTAVEIVTIQPMLQFLLGVATCASIGPLLLSNRRSRALLAPNKMDNSPVFLTTLCSIALYWFILPYGYQGERFHGEGTARLSASLLSAFALLSWIATSSGSLTIRERSFRFVFMTASVALLATLNPLVSILPGIFLVLALLDLVWRNTVESARVLNTGLVCLAAFLTAAIIVSGEPYFSARIIDALRSAPTSNLVPMQPATASSLSFEITLYRIWESLQPSRLISYLFAGTYTGNEIMPVVYLVLTILTAVWIIYAPRTAVRGFFVLLGCGATSMVFDGLSAGGSVDLPLYLIQPYVIQTVLQCGALIGFCWIIPTLMIAFSRKGVVLNGCVSLLTIFSLCLPSEPITARTAAFNMNVRGGYCGSLTCLNEGNRAALAFLEQLSANIINKYPGLTYETAPKILILGIPATLGVEKWVFPAGAARVVSLFSSLPVAFFYGRGHPDWSFDNYQSRVCQKLDLDWLKKRNVRYLFFPYREPGCLKKRAELRQRSKIIFEHDKSRILQIF